MGRLLRRWCNQKAKINQALTTRFILQGRPQRPVRNSLDHLVGGRLQRERNYQAERMRRLEIDH